MNDLVIRLRPGTDVDATKAQLVEQAFSDSGLAVTVMERSDEDAYRLLYDDIDSDQKFWNVFALLIVAGAAFGAFNLANRMVEAQRREIGIGMALGASPSGSRVCAPCSLGSRSRCSASSSASAWASRSQQRSVRCTPACSRCPSGTPICSCSMFAQAAALGFVIPVVATAWPVWRAVRVPPVDAITTTHRSSRAVCRTMLRRLPWPRSTYARMPIGNVLRTPRRTLLTALGIAAAVTALISILGMIDSFVDTIDRNDREVLQDHPDRVTVALQGFHLDRQRRDHGDRGRRRRSGTVQPVVRFGARLRAADEATDRPVGRRHRSRRQHLDADHRHAVRLPADRSGLVISAEAASDLGVGPGDTVIARAPGPPRRRLRTRRDAVRVAASPPEPVPLRRLPRPIAAAGVRDSRCRQPALRPARAPGRRPRTCNGLLFGLPSVASVQPVGAASKVVKDSLDDFVGIFRVLAAVHPAARLADRVQRREHQHRRTQS